MLLLQGYDFSLCFRRDHALAMQLAVGARMRLVAGGKKVSGDIAFSSDKGHDLDLVLDIRKLGEELGLGVALENIRRNGISSLVGIAQTEHVCVIKEDLSLQHITSLLGDISLIAECDVEQHFDRWATLHMRQEFQRESGRDFRNDGFAEDDLLQEGSLDAGGARGAGQSVIDEELEGIRPLLVTGIADQGDDFSDQSAVIDRFGREPLSFSAFDLSQVIQVQVHRNPNVFRCMRCNAAPPNAAISGPRAF
jgi:hypothetical protein